MSPVYPGFMGEFGLENWFKALNFSYSRKTHFSHDFFIGRQGFFFCVCTDCKYKAVQQQRLSAMPRRIEK
jgi:hypothetical protein